MAKKIWKEEDLLPCTCYFPRDGEELNYDDVLPEEREQKYIRFEEMTEEQKAAHKLKREKRLSEAMNRHFQERPDLYHQFCQSETVKRYDREHGYID